MDRTLLALLVLAAVLTVTPAAGASSGTHSGPACAGTVRTVYPNPVTPEDVGERVTLSVPANTDLGGLALADGETVARLPNRTASGRLVLTTAPGRVENHTDGTVVPLSGSLSLSNAGERVRLTCADGSTADAMTYPDAPEGERWDGEAWTPLGATHVAPTGARDVPVTAFVLPDAPGPPLAALRSADRSIRLAGYTFTSERVAGALVAAERRGVSVRVLVEGGPVGGVSRAERDQLDALAAAGANVTVLDGPRSRYRFHHPKYAVVDDQVVVTSENWKATGVGGGGTRGWGVVADSPALAADLRAVFDADAGWRDGVPWEQYRRNATFQNETSHPEQFPTRFPTRRGRARRVRLLVAPDNAETELLSLVRSADRSLRVEQVSIDRNQPLLDACVAAAERGVDVKVLLSGAWYVREENRALADRLNARAAREGLPLEARLVEPRSRFEHVHVKGIIVDGDRAVVGSLNWNNVSARENREVVLVVSGGVVDTYRRAFAADWHGGAWRVSMGALGALVPAVGVAGVVLYRRVSFAA